MGLKQKPRGIFFLYNTHLSPVNMASSLEDFHQDYVDLHFQFMADLGFYDPGCMIRCMIQGILG